MAITENKVLTRYTADVSQELQALDSLMRKIDQLKQKETAAADNREEHFDQLVLDLTRSNNAVEESAMSWDGLNKSGATFGSAMSTAGKAVQGVAKAMAPWNQAVELAGKAVRFANEGLDAYAKTSADAAYEVSQLKKEFAGYEQAVMAATGKIALELLKPAMSFDEMRKSIIRVENTQLWQRLYGGKSLGFFGDNEAGNPVSQLTNALGHAKDAAGELFKLDTWNTGALEDTLGRVKEKIDETRKATKDAALEAARWRAELAALASKNAKEVTDELVKTLEGETAFSAVNSGVASYDMPVPTGPSSSDLGKAYEELRASTAASNYESFRAGKQATFLEETFGSTDEFNVYAEAFNMLGGAVTSAMDAWIDGSMSAGQAIKKFLADALKGIASQMAVESLKHGAYAIGSLAFGDVRGAGQHAAAAAAFGAGAAAAAVAARSLGGGGGSGSDQRGAGASGGGGRGEGGSINTNGGRDHRGDGGSESTRPVIMIVGSSFDDLTPRQRRQKAEETFERARRERDE